MGRYSSVKVLEKESVLNTALGLGVTCEVNSWLMINGMAGVTVNSSVGVMVGVCVLVGVWVTVGVCVMVGVNVAVGDGSKIL